MNRRKFLGSLCAAAYVAPLVFSIRSAYPADEVVDIRTLSSFLDILIPKDITPSASQLDIPSKLVRHAHSIENYIFLLRQGLTWINSHSRHNYKSNFSNLTVGQQEKITHAAASAEAPAIVQLYFTRVRNDSFFIYYSQPDSWSGMIESAPQPSGYMDYKEIG